jgi:hypothetical protein
MHPTSVYMFLLVISVIYFVAAGVLALWFPADGLDRTRSQGVEMTVIFSRARRDQVDVRRTNW